MINQSKFDITKLTTSWTKFDIVQVLDILYDKETLISYVNQDSKINLPILKSFLGMKSLKDKIPYYWLEILKFPKEKGLFGLFSLILTHHSVMEIFRKSGTDLMTGLFQVSEGKMYTNIRSCLVESGASKPIYRRVDLVPYDFSILLTNKLIGPLFKDLLIDRLNGISKDTINEGNLRECLQDLRLHEVFCQEEEKFLNWILPNEMNDHGYLQDFSIIDEVQISKFYSIEEKAQLNFEGSKEIYFVGENGDGKSLVLMAIYLAFNQNYVLESTDQERTGKIREIIKDNKELRIIGKNSLGVKNSYLSNLFAYGTHRGRFGEDHEKYGFMSLFDSEVVLISPEKWLKDQKLFDLDNSNSEYSTIDIIEEVIYNILERNVRIKFLENELFFFEKGRQMKFLQLSEGYKSITIFVIDLIYRLQGIAKSNLDIFKIPAVVLVDEIDLHLHPKWKKVIVSKLRETFKYIQFIFTTHSPTIIQGASDEALIFKVYRNDEDGISRISEPYYRKNLNHLMLNTLVTSSLFSLESARLDINNSSADTSENFLLYKINDELNKRLDLMKKRGDVHISDKDIEDLIKQITDQELSDD
ncbi:AAA family ATPase [Sphingobacterium humi]|uniref:AAA family ATPase n=1 Tax=Sphingobacterium humi TaxID=1796905 RepID=A0A6N8L383_9SPHI|nr:AAA family ATPase [Sphingobacterium humi]MVZ63489.1 AAA family ATPase [Sphingobacterium humi]